MEFTSSLKFYLYLFPGYNIPKRLGAPSPGPRATDRWGPWPTVRFKRGSARIRRRRGQSAAISWPSGHAGGSKRRVRLLVTIKRRRCYLKVAGAGSTTAMADGGVPDYGKTSMATAIEHGREQGQVEGLRKLTLKPLVYSERHGDGRRRRNRQITPVDAARCRCTKTRRATERRRPSKRDSGRRSRTTARTFLQRRLVGEGVERRQWRGEPELGFRWPRETE